MVIFLFFNDSCFDIAPNFKDLCNYSSRMKIYSINKKKNLISILKIQDTQSLIKIIFI